MIIFRWISGYIWYHFTSGSTRFDQISDLCFLLFPTKRSKQNCRIYPSNTESPPRNGSPVVSPNKPLQREREGEKSRGCKSVPLGLSPFWTHRPERTDRKFWGWTPSSWGPQPLIGPRLRPRPEMAIRQRAKWIICDYGAPESELLHSAHVLSQRCGHYTQVLWDQSFQGSVGCVGVKGRSEWAAVLCCAWNLLKERSPSYSLSARGAVIESFVSSPPPPPSALSQKWPLSSWFVFFSFYYCYFL